MFNTTLRGIVGMAVAGLFGITLMAQTVSAADKADEQCRQRIKFASTKQEHGFKTGNYDEVLLCRIMIKAEKFKLAHPDYAPQINRCLNESLDAIDKLDVRNREVLHRALWRAMDALDDTISRYRQ